MVDKKKVVCINIVQSASNYLVRVNCMRFVLLSGNILWYRTAERKKKQITLNCPFRPLHIVRYKSFREMYWMQHSNARFKRMNRRKKDRFIPADIMNSSYLLLVFFFFFACLFVRLSYSHLRVSGKLVCNAKKDEKQNLYI